MQQTPQHLTLCSEQVRTWGLSGKRVQDFVYCAETYGRIIISEHCLPNDRRTIKPISIGGIAGGEVLLLVCGTT